ncbi:MAG: prepilin-type N-terminal cleavage/methylation domain-containing protein [Parvularculaceae bacterium]
MTDRARNAQAGMTLVEVLVAFAILAGVLGSVLTLLSQNARFMIAAEDRLMAQIAAYNLAVVELARATRRAQGASEGVAVVGDRRFAFTRSAIEPRRGVLQIDYVVRRADGRQALANVSLLMATR